MNVSQAADFWEVDFFFQGNCEGIPGKLVVGCARAERRTRKAVIMRWSRVDEEEVWAELFTLVFQQLGLRSRRSSSSILIWKVRWGEVVWRLLKVCSSLQPACLWIKRNRLCHHHFFSCHHYLMHSQGQSDYFLLFGNTILKKREHLSPILKQLSHFLFSFPSLPLGLP